MDFFSSLKTAYDSIGSEVSKTFDSSDFESDSASRSKTEPVAVIDPEETSEHKTKVKNIAKLYIQYGKVHTS